MADGLTRRNFLRLGTAAGAGLLVPSWLGLGCGDSGGQTVTAPPQTTVETATAPQVIRTPATLDRFIDPLPIPPVLTPDRDRFPHTDYYEVRMSQFGSRLHSQLPETVLWGYGKGFPGPTIEARRGRKTRVRWINDDLPQRHLLEPAIDPTIYHGREYPDVRTVVHLHGAFVAPESDGQPDAWSTPGGRETGERYYGNEFTYPNDQPATMLWYHDHGMHTTRLNVYAGLAGLYFIRDDDEDRLGLPSGEYEIPLAIADRNLAEDASLTYPTDGITPLHPVWVMRVAGEIPLVNGKAYPYLDAEPRRYRLRLLNASNSRTWNLWFDSGGGALPFHMIGGDGGFLPAPVELQRLRLGPAERADVILDLTGADKGSLLTLRNDAPMPYPEGGMAVPDNLMQIRVSRDLDGEDQSTPVPRLSLPQPPAVTPTPGIPKRVITMAELGHGESNVADLQINFRYFHEPVAVSPAAGTTEIWEVVNLTLDAHPFHVHLVQFQVLDRQPFDQLSYWNDSRADHAGVTPSIPDPAGYLTGPAVPRGPEEAGLKDTAMSMPAEVLRIAVPFHLPPDTATPARYIFHCHILEHEDNDMMRPFEVT